MTDDLEPIHPREAVDLYLQERETDLAEKTLENYRYRLYSFVTWCEDEADIENLNELTGRDLHRYRVWRRQDGGDNYIPVAPVTLQGILAALRKFLEWAAAIDAVEQGMRERVMMPDVDREDESADEYLDADRAREVLDYLDRYQYASRDHVILVALWHTGIRLGTLRTFDLGDFDPDARCLDVRHRPETGTPLKNGTRAERSIAVGEHYVSLLEEFIANHRVDVLDDHGRRPLIASREGRYSEGSIRETIYRLTLPCYTGSCPHDKDPDTCEWTEHGQRSECPSSRSPHGVRRGSITKHLNEGTPEEIVSERMNVTSEVLDKHYDQRSHREKMELRREFISDA